MIYKGRKQALECIPYTTTFPTEGAARKEALDFFKKVADATIEKNSDSFVVKCPFDDSDYIDWRGGAIATYAFPFKSELVAPPEGTAIRLRSNGRLRYSTGRINAKGLLRCRDGLAPFKYGTGPQRDRRLANWERGMPLEGWDVYDLSHTEPTAGKLYQVKQGDTLSGISCRCGYHGTAYALIWERNQRTLRSETPESIYPGEVISLPSAKEFSDWWVDSGAIDRDAKVAEYIDYSRDRMRAAMSKHTPWYNHFPGWNGARYSK